MRRPGVIDGFWLPRRIRERVVSAGSSWEELSFANGRECGCECEAQAPGAVTACWPQLDRGDWSVLLEGLAAARRRAPRGPEFWGRLQAAMRSVAERLSDATDPIYMTAFDTVPRYTGYSPAMIGSIMSAPELWDLEQMAFAFSLDPTRVAMAGWESLPGLPGRLRFFPGRTSRSSRLWARVPVPSRRLLFEDPEAPQAVTGYGAGNVPGTALMIALLSLSTTLAGGAPPMIVIRNSRREPLFSPLVLGALEEADEELVSTVAVAVWDYDDQNLQRRLLDGSDLVIAAAGDDTISRIAGQITAGRGSSMTTGPRLHAHGHKVSFTAIGREMLVRENQSAPLSGDGDFLRVVALLAGLDSIFWDQNGCLSSRIHFVEQGAKSDLSVQEYAVQLTAQLRRLSHFLPRGAWPLRQLRDNFDRYKALESTRRPGRGLRVLSNYDDEFVVVLDERLSNRPRFDPRIFSALVNDCQGRMVMVRPVDDLLDVPRDYLGLLPAKSLQSLSVAVGRPSEGLTPRFLDFATACGAQGVTAIRVVGRGAFPQLAYSWDGLIPLDLLRRRPPGHFSTIEFDTPFDAMMETYLSFRRRIARPGAAADTSLSSWRP
jgi:hypothetical protein